LLSPKIFVHNIVQASTEAKIYKKIDWNSFFLNFFSFFLANATMVAFLPVRRGGDNVDVDGDVDADEMKDEG
jgi:hypothetical protein